VALCLAVLSIAVAPQRRESLTGIAPSTEAGVGVPITLSLAGAVLAGLILRHIRTLRSALRASEQRADLASRNEAHFRQLFDSATDAQLLVDGNKIIGANPAAVALLAPKSLPPLLGSALTDVLPDAQRPAEEDDVLFETDAIAQGGLAIPVALRRTRIPTAPGALTHFDLRDLRQARQLASERKELEAQLLASQRLEALGTLAGGVAHDFNNLLTVVRSNAEIAQMSANDGDRAGVQESLAAVVDASDRARDIVKQILLFSRRGTPSHQRLNLAVLITDAQTLLRATIPTTVQLLVEVRDSDAWMMGDSTQMQQLLLNLCSNAEHAMRPTRGGLLRITVDVVDLSTEGIAARHPALEGSRFVRLAVQDTGVGMSEDVREQIFEPFFTTKPVGEGTGLGMAVLHGILVAHNGSVNVASREGAGTQFELVFSKVAAPVEGASVMMPTPLASAAIATVRHRTPVAVDAPLILLVDDDLSVLRAANRSITSIGLRVLTASSGAEALKLLAVHADVALLITDQTMPGMTGTALAEIVRGRLPTLPIILSTGYVGRINPERLRAARISSVLDKPYTLAHLTDAIHDAFRSRPRAVATIPE
jgi:two-component system, cell cycle sensor histidine kinase and response regulator CckA